jgi:hypothetical protein
MAEQLDHFKMMVTRITREKERNNKVCIHKLREGSNFSSRGFMRSLAPSQTKHVMVRRKTLFKSLLPVSRHGWELLRHRCHGRKVRLATRVLLIEIKRIAHVRLLSLLGPKDRPGTGSSMNFYWSISFIFPVLS